MVIMKQIGDDHCGLLSYGDIIWNMDETNVEAEFGKRVKVFYDSTSHYGVQRADVAHSGGWKHITCVMATSALGRVCPPFSVVQGTNVMSRWFKPLASDSFPSAYTPFITTLKC